MIVSFYRVIPAFSIGTYGLVGVFLCLALIIPTNTRKDNPGDVVLTWELQKTKL